MAHVLVKLPACANCAYAFIPTEPAEYCPRCGQQNHGSTLGMGHVAEEFLEGVFHFDGKIFRTLRLLLFWPGELTRRFLIGHRVPYVPPIRLYVFISFVVFFLLSLNAGHEGSAVKVRVASLPPHPTGHELIIGPRLPLTQAQLDSLPEHLTRAQADSVLRRHQVPVSLINRVLVQHMPRLTRRTPEEATHQVLKSLSIMAFVLMPLAALLLQAAYWRQRRPYLSYLILSVHLHCFGFVLLALLLGLQYLPGMEKTSLLLLALPLYLVLALHRLYGQSWGKTMFKSAILATGYSLLLGVGMLAALGLGLTLL
ncbi:DUF3667 domain-containing protein [Hymenobacter negativus]|uniref:DUF3667 domain-containing protein n=1 Tax=Hymenobacter negativus TaxID=2795026 RepID=A0ABS3QKD1_9BACT|nr:DUF3667 domain-containing protein [Hymenobacter negativus]MBO2011617.1 DUF3667 domain-containing protein [Hymenobacter negativus]